MHIGLQYIVISHRKDITVSLISTPVYEISHSSEHYIYCWCALGKDCTMILRVCSYGYCVDFLLSLWYGLGIVVYFILKRV